MPADYPNHRLFSRGLSPGRVPLADFVDDVFGRLPRVDQRRWAHTYLNGLLSIPGKKTLQRLAMAGPSGPSATRGLQQFINSSSWDWMPVRQELARRVIDLSPVWAWTTATSVIPKRGVHSVGVHRRFIAETGRTLNCQVAMGLFLSTADRSIPVDWRILLDDSWLGDEHRRRRARIPTSISPRPEWTHVLDFADDIVGRYPLAMAPLVVDLREAADAGPLAAALTKRGSDFVLEVGPAQLVTLARNQSARPGYRPMRGAVTTVREFLSGGSAGQPRLVTIPGQPQSRPAIVYSGLVRLPQAIGTAGGAPRVYRLLGEWSPTTREVGRYWITSLIDRFDSDILSFARCFAHTKEAVRDLKDRFGLLDFEGRSFPGWHHHMTMVSAAYAYSRLCRLVSPGDLEEGAAPRERVRRRLQAIR